MRLLYKNVSVRLRNKGDVQKCIFHLKNKMSKKYKSFTTKANNEEHCLYGFIKADNKITKNKKMNR